MSHEQLLDCVGSVICLAFAGYWFYQRRDPLRGSPLRPNRLDALVLLCIMLLYSIVTIVFEVATRPALGPGESETNVALQLRMATVQPAVSLIGGVACLWVGRHLFRAGLRGVGLGRRAVWRDLVFAVVTYVAVWPGVRALYALSVGLLQWLRPETPPPPHMVIEILHQPQHSAALKAWLVFGAAVAAPFAEEAFFRAYLQTLLKRVLRSRWGGVVATGAIFGLIHYAQPQGILPLFLLGCALGYVYERSGSLWCPMFLHALFNGVNLYQALNSAALLD